MKKFSYLVLLLLLSCSLAKEEIKLGAKWKSIGNERSSFIPRRNFGTAVIDGKIIVIGGYIWKNFREELANDVWISHDLGQTWKEIKQNAPNPTGTFTKRQKFGTVVINKDIYIIGGYGDAGSYLNDVWKSSDDGETWVEVVRNASFSPRYGHKAVVLENSIYIIGGFNGRSSHYNEVWKSDDLGQTWTELRYIPFKTRQGFRGSGL